MIINQLGELVEKFCFSDTWAESPATLASGAKKKKKIQHIHT